MLSKGYIKVNIIEIIKLFNALDHLISKDSNHTQFYSI